MKLMIVEDHRGMRQTLRRLLAGAHDEVCECSDGAEALESYRRFQPDCVLMDIAMKLLDGISATRQIITAFPDARVIIVTEHNDAPLRRAAEEAGAVAFVLKDNLLEARRWLAPRGSTGSASASRKPRNPC